MKRWIIILLTFFWMACNHQPDDMIGNWTVHSKHYSAIYQIIEEGNELKGLVLYYNDGTTKYRHDGKKFYYIFTGLKKDDGIYVDAITGATSKKDIPKSLEINKRNIDTLEVITYIRNKPLAEIWTRNKNN